jgi:hypothetical protein
VPSTTSERSRTAFLAALLDEIFALGDGRIVSASTVGWVPGTVYDKIFPKTSTTSKEIIDLCRTEHVIDEAFTLALSKLSAGWDRVKADRKQNLITLIRNHGLEDQFEPYMLRLSPADEEALLIRWDAADILFAQERQAVFGRAHIDDKGRHQLLSLGTSDEVLDILLNLLDHKADYDLSAVLLGASQHAYRYLDIVVGKCKTEYLKYLCQLRDLYTDFLRDVHPDLYGPGGTHSRGLVPDAEAHLQPFKTKFDALKNSISASVRNREIFDRMVSFTKEHPRYDGRKETTFVQTIFDQSGQKVVYQYNAAGNINFGAVQNQASFSEELQKLRGEIGKAKDAGALTDEDAADADYQINKAAIEAKKDDGKSSTIAGYLETAKNILGKVTALSGLVIAVSKAIELAHSLF